MAINLNSKNNIQVIRDYIIKDKIGIGSYGVVYKVLKKGDKQYYVLKQISLFNMNKAQVEEVKNESKILSSLSSTYIVKYYDSFTESSNLNIIMEYCDGGDLSKLLSNQMKNGKLMSEDKIWNFFIQISLGIAAIHNKKILHRDLKTLNIFLTKDDRVKIGDLGVAKILNQTNFARTFVGTPYYLSPEICEEKPYNEKSDVWALGCILYEMATYKHPFNASNQGALILKILRGKYDPISTKDFSQDLKKMIDLLLERNYFKRPSVIDIIKNPIFLTKARNLNLIENVINTMNELNITIENISIYKEISVSLYDKKVVQLPSDKRRSNENMGNVIKNVKIEFNNKDNEKIDPSKKLIQMNLPNNYKKQILIKKDKKDQISKQNNIVKQVINLNLKEEKGPVNAFNNINNLIIDKKERKVPVKLIKKPKEDAPIKKESGSNFNINNININGNIILKDKENQKIKEINQKINDFDSKLINDKKPSTPSENNKIRENIILSKPKRPFTSSLAKEKRKTIEIEEKEESILEEFEKYSNKKGFDTKLLDNPKIKIIEKAQMVIPKKNPSPLRVTNVYLNDDKGATNFFKDLMKSNYNQIFNSGDIINPKYIDINNFVNDLNKKSSSNFSDDNSSKMSKLYDDKISISEFLKNESEENNKLAKDILKESKLINISKRNDELVDTVPLYKNNIENNLNFQVCYENVESNNRFYQQNNHSKSNQNNFSYYKSTENNSVSHSNVKCLTEDSFDQDNNSKIDDEESENEEDHSNDDEEEAVEDVSVIKDLKINILTTVESNNITVDIEKDTQQEFKELIELKEKFIKKINHYKEQSKKSSGDKDFNKIFEYYMQISENQDDDELSNKIESYIRNLIPENYFDFIQNFYNLIYYEIQLVNVDKELELRKII